MNEKVMFIALIKELIERDEKKLKELDVIWDNLSNLKDLIKDKDKADIEEVQCKFYNDMDNYFTDKHHLEGKISAFKELLGVK